MKNLNSLSTTAASLCLLFALCFLACNSAKEQTDTPSAAQAELPATTASDEAAIKNVIISETEHFMSSDSAKWADSFVREPFLLWSVTNGSEPGDVLTMRGWNELSNFMGSWFRTNKTEEVVVEMRKETVSRDRWMIEIRGNTAWVSFNQHIENQEKKTKLDVTETRILEKINGAWKIALSSSLADFKDATPPVRTKY
ncbi:MAG: hypothetical protein AAB316_23135 [Bacteroidota bacterium]